MKTFAIYEGNMERLEKKIKSIRNKCKKYGCDFHYAEVGEEFRTLEDEQGRIYTARFVLVEAEGTVFLHATTSVLHVSMYLATMSVLRCL